MSAGDGNTIIWQVMKGMDRSRKSCRHITLKRFANMPDRKTAGRFVQAFIFSTKRKGIKTTHCNAYCQQMYKAMQLRGQQEIDNFKIEELNTSIDSMKVRRAAGPDDIQISSFKQLSASAKDKLVRLFNQSYAEGTTPSVWRRAEMISIEQPRRTHAFRPISLTNVLVRCMERLILTRLSPWTGSILPPDQAGFRRHRSCEEPVSAITESITQAVYSKKVGISLVLD